MIGPLKNFKLRAQPGPLNIPLDARAGVGQKFEILARKPRIWWAKNWLPAPQILGPVRPKRW
jgi:hypothetical protein